MSQEQDFISDIMGFDPSNLNVFNEQEKSNDRDRNIYKTNPVKMSKSEDGHYHSKIKILYNPFDIRRSIIAQCQYVMHDQDGWLFVNSSLAEGNKECPIFKGWKKLWFSGDEAKKEWAKKMFERNESKWVLVQIMEDENQPDLVGQIKIMKLPITVYNKLQAKMHPTDGKKQPVALMDYLLGPILEMDVQPGPDDPKQPNRKQREINYDLCDFDTEYAVITKTDATPLFTDDEMEIIDAYATAKQAIAKAKTEAKKAEAQAKVQELFDDVKTLYQKAINYLKENTVNLDEEVGYHPWDEKTTERVNRWLEAVLNMQDPQASDINAMMPEKKTVEEPADPADTTQADGPAADSDPFASAAGDDSLPF